MWSFIRLFIIQLYGLWENIQGLSFFGFPFHWHNYWFLIGIENISLPSATTRKSPRLFSFWLNFRRRQNRHGMRLFLELFPQLLICYKNQYLIYLSWCWVASLLFFSWLVLGGKRIKNWKGGTGEEGQNMTGTPLYCICLTNRNQANSGCF